MCRVRPRQVTVQAALTTLHSLNATGSAVLGSMDSQHVTLYVGPNASQR